MQQSRWRTLGVVSVALATSVLVCDTADAGKRRRFKSNGSSSSHGSSGSSGGHHYASHGSSGSSGSSSSHGSSGSSGSSSSHGSSGSSGSSSSHGSSGSSGSSSSHGSSGSSGGWYSSHGSSGSSSSHGSSGGVVISYSKPIIMKPTAELKKEAAPLPPPVTKIDANKATLVVKVPADATVFLVGRKMASAGTERRFSIPILDSSKEYTYPIRIEVVRNGKTLVSELKQKVRGGKEFALAVAESPNSDDVLALVALR